MKGKSSVVFSLFAKVNFKILVVGDKDVGKTSLIIHEIKHTFSNKKNVSLGIYFYSKTIEIDKDEIALQIWDTVQHQLSRLQAILVPWLNLSINRPAVSSSPTVIQIKRKKRLIGIF